MCGRFSLFTRLDSIQDYFDAEFTFDYEPRHNIAPGDNLAVIQNYAPGEIDALEWGLIPSWVDDPDDWPKPINARSETVAEKPAFRSAFKKRRCLVIADGFYEWQGQRGAKRPYRIERADNEPFAFAGLWESWGGNGDARETVTIITTEPNDVVAPIHDRMPVMLEPDDEAVWLSDDDPETLLGLLDPYPDALTDAYEISTAVNDPGNDSPAVVEPVGSEQSGLGDFG